MDILEKDLDSINVYIIIDSNQYYKDIPLYAQLDISENGLQAFDNEVFQEKLSRHTSNVLKRNDIMFSDLLKLTPEKILKLRNCGTKSLSEIVRAALSFKNDIES